MNTPLESLGRTLSVLAVVLVACWAIALAADAPPPAPPISSFVPAAPLLDAVDSYVVEVEKSTADAETFDRQKPRIRQASNTLVALALVLAMHDDDHRLKTAAPALLTAAQAVAKAPDYELAKAASAALGQTTSGAAAPSDYSPAWEKVASLGALMDEVQILYNKLRRGVTGRRFESTAADSAQLAAVVAAISQVVLYDTHEVKDPGDLDAWYDMCAEMRDSAAELHVALQATDQEAAKTALERLDHSCHDCHAVFRPDLE